MKYQLTMTEKQASVIALACEFYARIKMGQFGEVTWNTLFPQLVENDAIVDEYCHRRDSADELLYKARSFIYPELYGVGHSYGIGKFEDADIAFGSYEVIRKALGRGDGPCIIEDVPKIETITEEDDKSKNVPSRKCSGQSEKTKT